MAESVTTSSIFTGESGNGVNEKGARWLWNSSGGNLDFNFEERRANKEPTGIQHPWMPSVQEQSQSNQGQDQPSGHIQAQVRPQPQLPPIQLWGSFPDGPCRAPKLRKIQLEKRDPDDLSFRDARKKWQEALWLTEENKKVQELIANKNLAIFAESEQARLAKVELAKTTVQLAKAKKMLSKCEERSRKIAQANAKMLAYISKKI